MNKLHFGLGVVLTLNNFKSDLKYNNPLDSVPWYMTGCTVGWTDRAIPFYSTTFCDVHLKF